MTSATTEKKVADALPEKAKEALKQFSPLSESQAVAAMTSLSDKVMKATKASHQYVKDNPYKLIGIGILVGLLIGRRRR